MTLNYSSLATLKEQITSVPQFFTATQTAQDVKKDHELDQHQRWPELNILQRIQDSSRRRCHHRTASSGRCVVPPWPCRTACLQRSAGTRPVSWRSWSVQRARGRPGRRLQVNNRMTKRLDNEERHVQEPLSEPSYVTECWQTTSSDEVHDRW